MRQALVIGGRGQSGTAITQRLSADGWAVTATTSGPVPDGANRPATSATEETRWISLDRSQVEDFAFLATGEIDLVVDAMAMSARHSEQLLSLGSRVGAVIVISTLSVYSDEEGRLLDTAADETSFPAWPVPIPEDWTTIAPSEDNYSTNKAAMEAVLRERAPWPVTIVRPGAIHGRNSHHLREWYFLKRILDRRRRVVLPFNGETIFQPTATKNLAQLISLAADQPGDRILNCGDLDPPSVAAISETIDDFMGWSTERVLVPGPEPRPNVGNNPWSAPRPVIADMNRAQRELGYSQAADYATALPETLDWAIGACEGRDWREVFSTLASYPTDMFDYEAEDEFLAT